MPVRFIVVDSRRGVGVVDKVFSRNTQTRVLNADISQKAIVSDCGGVGIVDVVSLEVKVVVVKKWRSQGYVYKVAVVGVEKGCGFFGARNNGIAHKLGLVGTGVGELVESKVTEGEGKSFILKFCRFQKKSRNTFVNLSNSVELFPFSRNALLKPKVEGNIVGEFFLKALIGSHHGLRGAYQKGRIPMGRTENSRLNTKLRKWCPLQENSLQGNFFSRGKFIIFVEGSMASLA